MQTVRSLIIAGVAVFALAGPAAVAAQPMPAVHHMTVRLDDGSVAEIEYTGDVAPKVVFQREPLSAAAIGWRSAFDWPISMVAPSQIFEPDPALAALDRLSTQMALETASLMHEAAVLSALPVAGLKDMDTMKVSLPADVTGYSVLSTWTSNGACTRSVETKTFADGRKPETVSHESGSCKAPHGSNALPHDSQTDGSRASSDKLDYSSSRI